MRRWGKHVCVCASKRQRKCVCLCYEICSRKIWAKKSVSSFLLLSSLFSFSFLGKVQSVAQEDQPHLGLCCDASQRATQVHSFANTHTHARAITSVQRLTLWFMFRASKQRRKADRIVLECQEQAYWLINRPPVRSITLYCIQLYCVVHATLQHSYMIISILGNY